jgi:hypothetical protein
MRNPDPRKWRWFSDGGDYYVGSKNTLGESGGYVYWIVRGKFRAVAGIQLGPQISFKREFASLKAAKDAVVAWLVRNIGKAMTANFNQMLTRDRPGLYRAVIVKNVGSASEGLTRGTIVSGHQTYKDVRTPYFEVTTGPGKGWLIAPQYYRLGRKGKS